MMIALCCCLQLVLPSRLDSAIAYEIARSSHSRSSHSQPTPRGGGVAFAVLALSSVIAMICVNSAWLFFFACCPGGC